MNTVYDSCCPYSFKSLCTSSGICFKNNLQFVISADDWNWICFSTSFYKQPVIRIINCKKRLKFWSLIFQLQITLYVVIDAWYVILNVKNLKVQYYLGTFLHIYDVMFFIIFWITIGKVQRMKCSRSTSNCNTNNTKQAGAALESSSSWGGFERSRMFKNKEKGVRC